MYKKYIFHNFLSFLLKKHFRTPINPCLIFLLVTIAIPYSYQKSHRPKKPLPILWLKKISIFSLLTIIDVTVIVLSSIPFSHVFPSSNELPPIPKNLSKEALQLVNYALLLLRTATAAKARNRRHQLVNIRTNSLDFAITERIGQILACLRLLQFFLLDDFYKLFLPLFRHIGVPLCHHVIHIVDTCNKGFNQLLFAAQFRAGINRLANRDEHFFIIAMGIMVLFLTSIRM